MSVSPSSFSEQYEASRRQEAAENLFYQLKLLKEADTAAIGEKRIRNLMSCYQRCENLHCPKHLRTIVPHYLLYFCFLKEIENSELVAEVLHCVYEMCMDDLANDEDDFVMTVLYCSSFICDISIGGEQIWDREIYRDRKQRRLKRFSHITYYLKHARIRRLTFEGRRLTELICDIVTLFFFYGTSYDKDFLLPLLQYGGRFTAEKNETSERVHFMILMLFEDIVLLLRADKVWDDQKLKLRVPLSDLRYAIKTSCRCFHLMLKSVPNPYATTFDIGADEITRQVAVDPLPDINELRHMYEALFPGMGYGYRNPPSLQHSCRYIIRERLNENWQLPDGINKLGLPASICKYINLSDD